MYETTLSFEMRDGVLVAHVRSELDLASAPTVRRYLVDAVASGAPLVVSLAGCSFVDSAGFAPLLELADRLGDGFALVATRGTVARRIVDLARLHGRLRCRDDVDAAIRACKRGTVAA